MGLKDFGIERIYYRVLIPALEESVRVVHNVLIECILVGDQHYGRFPPAPSNTSPPLPGGHDCPRIADKNTQVQPAYVDPKLQGACGYDRAKSSAGKLLFDYSPLLGQKSGPVRADLVSEPAVHLDHAHVNQFGQLPGLGKSNRLEARFSRLDYKARRRARRMADPALRRAQEDEMPFCLRRSTRFAHNRYFVLGNSRKTPRKFVRVSDGCGK